LIGEIGVLLLMFLAGLELHVNELRNSGKVSVISGLMGVIVPVLLGFATGMLAGLTTDHSIFLGLTLGATSVSISARTLMELKQLRSRVGLGVLGAAVFDDILVILRYPFLCAGSGARLKASAGFSGGFILFRAAFQPCSAAVAMVRELPISQNIQLHHHIACIFHCRRTDRRDGSHYGSLSCRLDVRPVTGT
jgi:Kef-type K+ transport system membrane component KefB